MINKLEQRKNNKLQTSAGMINELEQKTINYKQKLE